MVPTQECLAQALTPPIRKAAHSQLVHVLLVKNQTLIAMFLGAFLLPRLTSPRRSFTTETRLFQSLDLTHRYTMLIGAFIQSIKMDVFIPLLARRSLVARQAPWPVAMAVTALKATPSTRSVADRQLLDLIRAIC